MHLDVFLSQFVLKWSAVDGNVPTDPKRVAEFRSRLLTLLPSEPVASKISFVRQHLVDEIAKNLATVQSPSGMVQELVMRAKRVDMPAGDPVSVAGAMVPFIGGGKAYEKKPGKEEPPPTDPARRDGPVLAITIVTPVIMISVKRTNG